MKKFPNQLWIVVLLLGWLFDFLFWQHPAGIAFAVYAALTLFAGAILLWLDGVKPSGRALILVPFILFFAVMTFVRREPMTAFLSHAFTLFLMAGLAVTYRGGRWLEYSLADYFSRGLDLFASTIVRPISFAVETRQMKRETGEGEQRPNKVWPVLRGVLIAIPVVAFFAALLSSADLVFAQRLGDFAKLFKLENLPEYIFRCIYILIIAYALAGAFLHVSARSGDEKLLGLEKPLVPRFLGFTEAVIVLGSLVLLFGVFVTIQFQYFFGGQTNINLTGFTYSEYARRGFGELVTVAFFALLLLLSLSAVVKRENALQQNVFSSLGALLVALVAVMLVSAYQRLVLYETAYGFTRLRTYTHVFMIWIALLLITVVVLDVLQRQRTFALAALLAAVGFALSLSLLNVDTFIFRQNIQRFAQGEDLDVGYLASLSSDALPAMVELYHTPSVDQATRERVGAALACIHFQKSDRAPETPAWQAFHLADYRAERALEQAKGILKDYKVVNTDWPVKVYSPQGQEFQCYSQTFD